MNPLGLLKPEYYYQPHKLVQRLQNRHLSGSDESIDLTLPWKMPIRVRAQEEHGRILKTLGVIDLPVTETLWRLTDSGESAVDVGANIGYMTAVLAARVGGTSGKVTAFEAHPEIFAELDYNIQHWRSQTQIESYAIAVSNQPGEVTLAIDAAFTTNRGLATVVSRDVKALHQFLVKATTLDARFSNEAIHVLKVDVEGHEFQVFQGAEQLLQQKRIRDCVFEEHGDYPTPATTLLEKHGYKVWRIARQFWKPILVDPTSTIALNRWLPTSFLATSEPDRALQRLHSAGWHCLSHSAGESA